MKKPLIALITVLAFGLSSYALENERVHGKWISGIASNGSSKMVRAASDLDDKYALMLFVVDFPGCKDVEPKLIVIVQDGAEKAGLLNSGSFQARVDDRKIISGKWFSSANDMGDKAVFVTLIPDGKRDKYTLVRDIMKGKTLRVKLEIPQNETRSDDFYIRFSLKGSSAAINRAAQLCKNGAIDSDKEYFDHRPVRKYPAIYRY